MLKKLSKHKVLVSAALIFIAALLLFGVYLTHTLRKAHSTFENYYTFRGCTQLLEKTPTSGVCKTRSGQTITIVEYRGKWYLKDDLPTSLWGHLN